MEKAKSEPIPETLKDEKEDVPIKKEEVSQGTIANELQEHEAYHRCSNNFGAKKIDEIVALTKQIKKIKNLKKMERKRYKIRIRNHIYALRKISPIEKTLLRTDSSCDQICELGKLLFSNR